MEQLNFDLTILLRVVSALLLGFAIGLEREMTNKYAGLRTNILVCLGACVFTIISIYGFPAITVTAAEYGTRDTARVAAQVVTGIGFIGGGTVLRHGATVFGLTTAATLFMAAAIGMACGAGMYDLAIIGTIVSIITLVSVRFFEKNILVNSTKNTKRLKVTINCQNANAGEIYDYIIDKYQFLKEISKKISKSEENITKITVILDVKSKTPMKAMYKEFQAFEGVESISIQESNEA
ncbi:MgtC/SapB family protein [bacterium]|nr:MgtC/SapB family protein [bacterium]